MTERLISPLIDINVREFMNISIEITGELLEYLDLKVRSGLYKSRSEIIRNAIREMIHKDLEEQLRASGLTLGQIKRLRKKVAGDIIARRFKELG